MTDYHTRWLEICLEEQLGGQRPPDQVDAIVQAAQTQQVRLQAPAIGPHQRSPHAAPTHYRLWTLAGSLAACLLAALWLSGTSRQKAMPNLADAALQQRDGFMMPVSTRSVHWRGRPVLQNGWAFASEQSERMQVGISLLEFQGARAVVRSGGVPDTYEAMMIVRQLQSSGLVHNAEETEMLKNPNKWIAGVGLAVCLLTGEAMLNQQPLLAQESEPAITITQVFQRYDTNGNGQLETEECVCKGSKMCDLDQDGQVTMEEFSKGIEQHAGSHEVLLKMVHALGGLEKFYQAAKSGSLEKVVHDQANVSMDSVFAFLDKNGSGVLEKEECICQGSKHADANTDGKVTQAELRQVAEGYFGSEEAFLDVVREKGGVAGFFASVSNDEKPCAATACSLKNVFAKYDQDASGVLEKSECICEGTRMADFDNDGTVSQQEFVQVAIKLFGSQAKAEQHIAELGGADKFYAAVASGKNRLPDDVK